jgi:A/G-specific adenine glycosylase
MGATFSIAMTLFCEARSMHEPHPLPLDISDAADREWFRSRMLAYYRNHGRELPWRNTRDPYRILVSEFMLQQTQVARVMQKYDPFIAAFPDFGSVHRAGLRQLLALWSGLGYNRRCVNLKRCADLVCTSLNGALPESAEELQKLPGIGRATASAVAAFAFEKPVVFIETNIRSLYHHFFFRDGEQVTDSCVLLCVEKTLDRSSPRTWYYALMDYGAMLKKARIDAGARQAARPKQPPFHGSNRQARGRVLKLLIAEPGLHEQELAGKTGMQVGKIRAVLSELRGEGFVKNRGASWEIAD